MTLCTVEDCARPAHQDLSICPHHCWVLSRDLADIPALADELDLALSRQTANGPRNGPRSSEKPLPFDVNASSAAWLLRNTLTAWIQDVDPQHPHDQTLTAMAVWLLARHSTLVAHADASDIVSEIRAAVSEGWRAVDSRAERMYVGRCSETCSAELYARLGTERVRCRACGAEHHVRERRDAMLTSAATMLLPVRQIAVLAAMLGTYPDTTRTEARLRKWVQRGVIVAQGMSPDGRPTYPFGDTYSRLLASDFKCA